MRRRKRYKNVKAGRVTITMAPDLLERLDGIAEAKRISRSGLINDAVMDWLAWYDGSEKKL